MHISRHMPEVSFFKRLCLSDASLETILVKFFDTFMNCPPVRAGPGVLGSACGELFGEFWKG